jgi:hypothetical protein
MPGGKSPRRKGDRAEREFAKRLQEAGFAAERVPCSGSAGGSFSGDLNIPLLGVDRVAEVKVRRDGFTELYRWLADRDLLIVRRDRAMPLVIIPWTLAVEVARAAEANRKG